MYTYVSLNAGEVSGEKANLTVTQVGEKEGLDYC